MFLLHTNLNNWTRQTHNVLLEILKLNGWSCFQRSINYKNLKTWMWPWNGCKLELGVYFLKLTFCSSGIWGWGVLHSDKLAKQFDWRKFQNPGYKTDVKGGRAWRVRLWASQRFIQVVRRQLSWHPEWQDSSSCRKVKNTRFVYSMMHLVLVPSPVPNLGLQVQTLAAHRVREMGMPRTKCRIMSSQPVRKPQ